MKSWSSDQLLLNGPAGKLTFNQRLQPMAKAFHAWIEIWQWGSAEFWSKYGCFGCTEVNLWSTSVQQPCQVFPAQSAPQAIDCNADQRILMVGKSPLCQNTKAQQVGFPHPHLVCGWGNWIIYGQFYSVYPALLSIPGTVVIRTYRECESPKQGHWQQ